MNPEHPGLGTSDFHTRTKTILSLENTKYGTTNGRSLSSTERFQNGTTSPPAWRRATLPLPSRVGWHRCKTNRHRSVAQCTFLLPVRSLPRPKPRPRPDCGLNKWQAKRSKQWKTVQ